jgi:WD40 repeat protein
MHRSIALFILLLPLSLQAQKASNKTTAISWTADWSTDDKWIAVGGDDSLLTIYDASNFTIASTIKLNSMIRCVRWSKNSKRLAVSTNSDGIVLVDMNTKKITRLPGNEGSRALEWNYNGQLLAAAGNAVVTIWNADGKLLRSIYKDDRKSYLTMDWNPSKNILMAGGDEIRIYDTSGKQLQMFRHRKENLALLTLKWHPSGNFLASGDYGHSGEGTESLIQFWKEDGSLLKQLHGSKDEYRNIKWSPDGKFLASASDALRIWDANGRLLYTGKSKVLLWGVDWNSKGARIVTTSSDGRVELWTNTAKLIKQLP